MTLALSKKEGKKKPTTLAMWHFSKYNQPEIIYKYKQ